MTPKIKKILYMAAGTVLLIVSGAAVALRLNMRVLKPRLEAYLSDAMGMDVRVRGGMGAAFFPRLALSLSDVSARKDGAEIITVEKIRIGLKLLPLFRREVRISRAGLIRPVFSIIRDKNGRYNFEKLLSAVSDSPFAVKKTTISRAKIYFIDEGSGGRVRADDVDATLLNLSYAASAATEPLNISFDGDIRCKTLALNELLLTNVVMKASGRDGILNIDPAGMDVFGGTGKGSVYADLTGATARYRISVALDRFRITELIRTSSLGHIPPKSIEGTLNFSADLTAEGGNMAGLKRSLNGGMSLNGENLMLHGIDIDALIPKYERSQNFNLVDVGAFFLAGPFGPALTKSYNFGSLYVESRGGKGLIRKLVSVWKVKNGVAVAADVALASKKYRLAMKGGLDFNTDRFADVTVAVLNKQGCAAYSQNVVGPFSKPSIGKASVFKSLTGPANSVLKSVWGLVSSCKVVYTGSVPDPKISVDRSFAP